jgi:hypothetical protein
MLSAAALGSLIVCLMMAGCTGGNGTVSGPSSVVREESASDEEVPDGPNYFADVTVSSGIDFTYRNGEEADHYTILESLGGGVALIDYDRDGLLDVFLTGGGSFGGESRKEIHGLPCRLYKNLGDFRFRDVTAEAGLDKLAEGRPWFYNHGAAVGDYDNDGWPDLLVTGYGRMALFHNDHGKFTETTAAAGLAQGKGTHWSTSATWADVNGNGHPDLVVVHYVDWSFANNIECRPLGPGSPVDVCPPASFQALPTRLYLNKGDGTFRDAGAEAGMKAGKGLGILVLDLDEDGKPDIYVANDTSGNQLYLNKGGGRFEEAALVRGVALNEHGRAAGSMGVDAADYDGSGHFSLFVTNFTQQSHALYHNLGQGWFQHASVRAGVVAIGLNFVGFGTAFLDCDNDGGEDLLIVNGHVLRHPTLPQTLAQRPVLLRNRWRPGQPSATAFFDDASRRGGSFFRGLCRGRGLAAGDLDNDGRLDVVISNCNEPAVLLRNVCAGGHWLGVELRGTPNRDAVGAELTLETKGRRLRRAIKGGGSYLSSGDRRVLFGLGEAATVERLTVRWPSGRTETWEGARLDVDHYMTLTEGKGAHTGEGERSADAGR